MAAMAKGLMIEEQWTAGRRKTGYMLAGKPEAVNSSKAFGQVSLVKSPGFGSSESRCPWHFCLVGGGVGKGGRLGGGRTERLGAEE